ncbi:MAG: hypothetical protein ACD_76C00044G0025 [uncultured bacterium]|nr:MAG: hypothetical protein ACD_76C00044G0025 [uncultured bacterium]
MVFSPLSYENDLLIYNFIHIAPYLSVKLVLTSKLEFAKIQT